MAAKAAAAAPPLPNVELPSNNIRFQIELEFIQCLASPSYLNFLAINRYFDNPAFMNYLQYLKYWKQPQYAKYIVYPHALAFLDMLDDERFRQVLTTQQWIMQHALASLGHSSRLVLYDAPVVYCFLFYHDPDDPARGFHDARAQPAVLPLADVPEQPHGSAREGRTGVGRQQQHHCAAVLKHTT